MVEIRPVPGLLDLDLGAVWRYRELLGVLIMRDVQVLYRQAALGVAWAIVQPVFAVLAKGKMPRLGLHPVVATPAEVERTKRVVEKVWRAISAGHFYPNPSPFQCSSCTYRQPCRKWAG